MKAWPACAHNSARRPGRSLPMSRAIASNCAAACGVAAGAEHGGRHAVTGGQAAALGVPLLRGRQRLQRLGARQVHALIVLAQMVRRFLEDAQTLRGARHSGKQRKADSAAENNILEKNRVAAILTR